MADWLTREQRSRNMASIRSVGNRTTEMVLVGLLREAGLSGWRRHLPLPGKPDFVFRKQHVAVFIDGCFWHACPKCYRLPQDNRPYWRTKMLRNKERDRQISQVLRSKGWRVLRVWEHSLKNRRSRLAVSAKLIKSLESCASSKGEF